ncbi:hypothetical protein L0F63_005517 [Massospora cicadina]|nr:hypothetical protein L0F63_005517 [Massospora cicadina]
MYFEMTPSQPPGPGLPFAQPIDPINPLGSVNVPLEDRLRNLQQAQSLWLLQSGLTQINPYLDQNLTQPPFGNTFTAFPSFEGQLPPQSQPAEAIQEIISVPTASPETKPTEPAFIELSKERAEHLFRWSLFQFQADGVNFLDIQYWIDFATEYFADEACYRHLYLTEKKSNQDFTADFKLLPFMLRLPYTCGALKLKFCLDAPSFVSHNGLHQLKYDNCQIFTHFPTTLIRAHSRLLVTFLNTGKMLAWDFTTFESEELIMYPHLYTKLPISHSVLKEHFKPKTTKLMQRLQLMQDITIALTLVENIDQVATNSSDDELTSSLALKEPPKYPMPGEISTIRLPTVPQSTGMTSPPYPIFFSPPVQPATPVLPTREFCTDSEVSALQPAAVTTTLKKVRSRKPKIKVEGAPSNSEKQLYNMPTSES